MEEENGTWRREYRKRKTPCITPMRGGNQEASKMRRVVNIHYPSIGQMLRLPGNSKKSAEENDKRNTSGLKQQTKQKISPYLLRTPILLFESIWIELPVELRMRHRQVSDLTIYQQSMPNIEKQGVVLNRRWETKNTTEQYRNVMLTLHNQSKEPSLHLQWIAIATPINLISCRHWVLSKQNLF